MDKKKNTKSISPLQAMIKKRDKNKNDVKNNSISETKKTQNDDNLILEVDPHEIRNWYLADRPESELVSVKQYAREFADPKIGQKIPCTVRPVENDNNFKYEIIAGEQRWRAAKLAGTKLKVIIKKLTNTEAAIEQIIENKRDNLSAFAQGMNYARLIKENLLKQKDLENLINKSPVEINRLLAFSQTPNKVWEAVSDMSKVSARTAAEIRSTLKKNPDFLDKIIELAPKIREGKLGAASLQRELNKYLHPKTDEATSESKIKAKNGTHLFTLKTDNNNILINLPKTIRKKVNQQDLETVIRNEIERQIK